MSNTLITFTQQWADNSIVLGQRDNTVSSQQPYRLRPSRLGRPAYITAIEHLIHLHGLDHSAVPTVERYGRMQDIFATGHQVEERIVNVMRDSGMVGYEYQVPCSFIMHDYTIEGTADLVIDNVVVDIKTASASNYKRLLTGYNDLVYRTQLALYAHALGLTEAALLLYCKDTSELTYKPIRLTDELDRVSGILAELRLIEPMTLDDAFEYVFNTFLVPEPPNQMRNKQPTGMMLVPPELRYEPTVCDVLWQTEWIDGTRYVTGANPDPINTIRNSYTLRA